VPAKNPARPDRSRRHRFDLDGDEVSLDFVNAWKIDESAEADAEHVAISLTEFALQSELLSDAEARAMAARLHADPASSEALARRALSLRSHLASLFSARADGRPLPVRAVECLNEELAAAWTSARLVASGGGLQLAWGEIDASPDSLLGPILRSAVDLLTGDLAPRLRICDSPTCSWLFVDHSRNRSRRWCSMETCGNRAKARRHYHRRTNLEEA